MKKNRLEPYRYWTKEQLLKSLLTNMESLNPPTELEILWGQLIKDGINSNEWEVLREYNGCTIVQDIMHPCPACFCHDYMWITGRGGIMSDKIFKFLMSFEAMSKSKIARRYLGVRIGWLFWFRWKKRHNEPTETMKKIYNYAKNKN